MNEPTRDARGGRPGDTLPEAQQNANALASWRIARVEALQGRPVRDSVAWLHAAFEGMEAARACGDAALADACAAEALAFALASRFGGPIGAVAEVAVGGVVFDVACRPCPDHRWRDATRLAEAMGHGDVGAAVASLASAARWPVHLLSPRRACGDVREPAWWMALYGVGGERKRRLQGEGAALVVCVSESNADAGIALDAEFASAPSLPPALDPGELLTLSDRLAQAVGTEAPVAPAERRAQRARLAEAIDLVALVLERLPADRPLDETDVPSTLGRALFDADPGRFDRERLQAVQAAWQRLLARFDAAMAEGASPQSASPQPDPREAADAREAAARDEALAAIAVLRAQLEPILWLVARDTTGELAKALRPRPDDYAKVFTPDIAEQVRAAYASILPTLGRPKPADPGQTQLLVHLCPAGMLADDNELSRPFPGGWRFIASKLNPHRIWVRWKFVRAGETAGMAYDGLVWVDDHWAWFPKAYRLFSI